MPKIVRLHAFGSVKNLKIDELPIQELKEGEVRLKIESISISRDNFMLIDADKFGEYGLPVPELPSRLGYEASGIVTEVGKNVDKSWIGKKVAPFFGLDEIQYGMFGEEAVIPASFLCEYPQNISAEQAAAFWVPYLTAYGALISYARVEKGDFVAITAAASSVGLAAIQIIKDLGAVPIAVIRSSGKKEKLSELGATHIVITENEDYSERIGEITGGKGVRVTFDPISGPLLKQLVAAASYKGIIFQYGLLSDEPVIFPLHNVIGKNLDIRGYTVSSFLEDKIEAAKAKQYILERIADGRFIPRVAKVFTMQQIAESYAYLNSNEQLGRIVISNI